MGVALTKGGNVSLSRQAPGLTAVTVGLGWQADTGYEPDAGALLCDRSGKVLSDEHFVFFNNLSSPEGSVRHSGGGGPVGGDDQQIHVELARVPGEVTKIVFLVSLYDARARGQVFEHLGGAHIRVVDDDGGAELARYDLATAGLSTETALVLGELYRHDAEWKFRAVGQGYASGAAGIAADYGVNVLNDSASPAPPVTAAKSAATTGPSFPSAPTAAPQPQPVTAPPLPPGSSLVTCFFDPTHGPGTTTVTWSPQWGVPRQIQTCGGCAQRVQTTVPPFYTPPQQGYPQPVQQGYPQPVQQGYPQPVQQGYPQQGHPDQYADHHQHGGGRRFGTGALIGAGAAGLIGGALLNEAFDDDEPEVVVNNYYED
ncbi:TerD family protein [Streptomyces sp. Ru72]|uniref:TerD family protein n=1 Tax=Streptomyces sp. Ru72 TaxID=2080747 RepID=UPI000CDCF07C|nr:TerD family protein [Streptomyces sp. Ru72]POX51575.1 TerD-family protein [Streptomyces sp. Ru72]